MARLLEAILSKQGGLDVALEIVSMRFHGRRQESPENSDNLMAVARNILAGYPFSKEGSRQDNCDYELASIAKVCLKGAEGQQAANEMCQHLAREMAENHIYPFNYPDLLTSLARVQPVSFLNAFVEEGQIDDCHRRRVFFNDIERHENPLNQIPDDELLGWCEDNPATRYILVASSMITFKKSAETGQYEWVPFVYAIFEKAPNLDAVMEHLADSIRPVSWSGSRADVLQSRTVLYKQLYDHDNEEVAAWASCQYGILQEDINRLRELETNSYRKHDQRFE